MDVRQAQSPPSPKLPLAFAPASIVNHTGQYGTLYLEQSMLNSEVAFRAIWKIIAMIPPRSYPLDRDLPCVGLKCKPSRRQTYTGRLLRGRRVKRTDDILKYAVRT